MPGLAQAKELRVERRKLAERMSEIMDNPAGPDGLPSTEQNEEFDRLHERQEELGDQIQEIEEREEQHRQRAEYLASIKGELSDSSGRSDAAAQDTRTIDETQSTEDRNADDIEYAKAFDAYLRYGARNLTPEAERALTRRFGEVRVDHLPDEVRAMGVAQDISGGFFVPEGFYQQVVEARQQFGGMRQARSFILSTSSGQPLPIPTDDDTSNTGAILAENTQDSQQDVTLGQTVLNAYMYTSRIVRVSRQLLQDSAFDIESYLGRKLGERIGRITNTHFTTGDAASKPEGVTVGAVSGVTAASSTAFTVDELLDLKHAVDPAYRMDAEWMFNDTVLRELKQKKDGDGRPLWQSGIAIGEPNTIDGDRYIVNQDMPALTSGNTPVAYGDFSLYFIRDVLGMQIIRLDERYADSFQVAFLGFSRHDGKLVDAGQNPVQVLTLA